MKGRKLTRGEAFELLMDGKSVYIEDCAYSSYNWVTGQAYSQKDDSWRGMASLACLMNDYEDELYGYLEPGRDFSWALEQALDDRLVFWDDFDKSEDRNQYMLVLWENGEKEPRMGFSVKRANEDIWRPAASASLPVRCFTVPNWRIEE